MSATATETPSSGLHDYLVTGETLFVTGAVLTLVSEIALTFRSLVAPNFVGLAIGALFILGILYLVNWLYAGKKEARMPAALWAAVQIVIAFAGAVLLLNKEMGWNRPVARMTGDLPQMLSIATYTLGFAKAAAYGFFLYLLTQRGPALFFLRHKGGETLEAPSPTTPPEDIHPTGVAVPLTADQADTADTLASTLQNAGIALMLAGFLQAVVGGQTIATSPRLGWLTLGAGVVVLVLGLISLTPVVSVRNIKERGSDTSYVVDALGKLGGLFQKIVLLALALIALGAGGIFVMLKG